MNLFNKSVDLSMCYVANATCYTLNAFTFRLDGLYLDIVRNNSMKCHCNMLFNSRYINL